MISFSKKETLSSLETLKTNSQLVVDRVYFVEGVGTFIATAVNAYTKYDYDWTSDINSAVNTATSGKVDKTPGTSGTIFTNSGTGGELVSSLYSVGVTSATGFGADNKLATEKGTSAYVAEQIASVNAGTQVAISGISDASFVGNVGTFTYTRVNGETGTFSETIDGLASGLTLTNNELKLDIKGGSPLSADVDGLVSGITYTGGTLSIGIKGKAAKTVNLPVEKFLHSAKQITLTSADIQSGNTTLFSGDTKIEASVFAGQTAGTQGIVFQLEVDNDDDATNNTYEYVFIPFSEIITDYTGTAPIVVNGKTISLSYNTSEFTVTDSKLTLNTVPSGKVNAPWDSFATSSWVDGNYISKFTATENTIALADGSQELKASNYQINNSAALTNSNTLVPTESVVSAFVNGNYIPKVTGEENEVAKFDANGNVISTGKTVGLSAAWNAAGTTVDSNFGGNDKLALESPIVDLLSFK